MHFLYAMRAASLTPRLLTVGPRLLRPPALVAASALSRRCAPAALTLARRCLVASPTPSLPTLDDVRRFAPDELERARLQLAAALDAAEMALVESGGSAEASRRRCEVARLLATTLIRLGSPLDAESVLNDALGVDMAHGPLGRRIACKKGVPGASGDELVEMSFLLGVCYQKSGREEQALEAFEEALAKSDGQHWRARFHMALLSISNGWHAQSEKLLQGVLEHNPGHTESIAILAKLVERRKAEGMELKPPMPSDDGKPKGLGKLS